MNKIGVRTRRKDNRSQPMPTRKFSIRKALPFGQHLRETFEDIKMVLRGRAELQSLQAKLDESKHAWQKSKEEDPRS